jgi:hypothetical protein
MHGNFRASQLSQRNAPALNGAGGWAFRVCPDKRRYHTVAKHAQSARATRAGNAVVERRTSAPVDPMINAYAWWLDQAGEWSNEAFRFVNRRLGKDLEAAAELMRCADANEALAVEARFASDLAADYLDEGKKLFELMAQAAAPQRSASQRHARGSH